MVIERSVVGTRSPSRLSSALRLAAAVLTILALLAAGTAIVTFRIANRIMREPPKPLENFPANVMPSFRIVDFPSLDGQTSLSGWIFPSGGTPRGTVVMVHGDGSNRLQMGVDTAYLYKHLVDGGFNVLSFDLRHCGDSAGSLTTYGYAEWEDVIAAVDYARRSTTTTGVVLYGFGSGTAACLAAWQELPASEAGRESAKPLVGALPLTKAYVQAMVLDGPAGSPDDFIRAAMARLGVLSVYPLPWTVPIAVRMSSGSTDDYPLAALASRFQRPLMVMERRGQDEPRSRFLSERLRLHPETTSVLEMQAEKGGSLFATDRIRYLEALEAFLDRHFPRAGQ